MHYRAIFKSLLPSPPLTRPLRARRKETTATQANSQPHLQVEVYDTEVSKMLDSFKNFPHVANSDFLR